MRDLAVVGLENYCCFIGVAVLQVPIKAVVGGIKQPIIKPFVERRLRLIKRPSEGLVPEQL